MPTLNYYENEVVEIAKEVKPSSRGDLEITAVINRCLRSRKVSTNILESKTTWLDASTVQTRLAAPSCVQSIEENQVFKILCLEDTAWRSSWISTVCLLRISEEYGLNPYGINLLEIAHK